MMTQRVTPLISTNLADLLIPGIQVSLSPEEAEDAGAFVEDALSEADAWEANEAFGGHAAVEYHPARAGMSTVLRVV